MEFVQITSVEETYFQDIMTLYQEAFPENQRHTATDFKSLVESRQKDFRCNAVLLNKSFVGFFNYWDLKDFNFAEHFAIVEAVRGNKIGEKVMKMIQSAAKLPLIFEVEIPDNETNARRIEFYRRLGYEIVPKRIFTTSLQ
ncbi:MAG: GNAT family N-acetyltransferase [Paludibacteraceae bacterium]